MKDQVTRRLIACLDTRQGRVVKGVAFEDLQEMGDPATLAKRYEEEGADEIVVLDVAATTSGTSYLPQVVSALSRVLSIPVTAGGGIRTAEDAARLFRAGADKVAVNTAAVRDPPLLRHLADVYGRQAVVLSVDVRSEPGGRHRVYVAGGHQPTDWLLWPWISRAVEEGAGEILLTSIDHDGRQQGYDVPLLKAVSRAVPVPVIASGGGLGAEEVAAVFLETGATAALLASALHQGKVRLHAIKTHLRERGVSVRWTA